MARLFAWLVIGASIAAATVAIVGGSVVDGLPYLIPVVVIAFVFAFF